METLNAYLWEVVANSSKCRKCALRHADESCFFAYECIMNDFSFFLKEEHGNECVSEEP